MANARPKPNGARNRSGKESWNVPPRAVKITSHVDGQIVPKGIITLTLQGYVRRLANEVLKARILNVADEQPIPGGQPADVQFGPLSGEWSHTFSPLTVGASQSLLIEAFLDISPPGIGHQVLVKGAP